MLSSTVIRPFDGSPADTEGLLAVEKATFDELPYSVEEVQTMLSGDGASGRRQHAWLAVGEDRVVGFVIAFLTTGLRGPCWEIDLLAVHPDWTRRGLATRLIRAASAHGMGVARRARAAVATDNWASIRAFGRVGFRPAGRCDLSIYRVQEMPPQPWTALGVEVREAAGAKEIARWRPPDAESPDVEPVPGGMTLLLVEHHGEPAGYAEVIEVETLLYRGLWIESLTAPQPMARMALVREILARAAASGLDEVGILTPEEDKPLQETLQMAGFDSLGEFFSYVSPLPLPGLADSSPVRNHSGVQAEGGHV